MSCTEYFTARGKRYEIRLEDDQWYEVRCGGQIVWPRSIWPLDPRTHAPMTKMNLVEVEVCKRLGPEESR
jgi:hypothetical protein